VDVIEKLRTLRSSTNPMVFVNLFMPEIAKLVVSPHGLIRVFHHYHHNSDDGLNYGTDTICEATDA
jgi:hypothetical protein